MRILYAKDYKRMPWKNGGGETVEIAVFPPDASVETFDWRISMATVASDGPFSSFPGIDRTLSILEGDGMALAIEDRTPVLLTQESAPLPFPADVRVHATLPSGPITDLNVMTRRAKWRHNVTKHIGALQVTAPLGAVLVLALDPLSVSVAGTDLRLSALDSLLAESVTPFSVTPDHAGGAFFLIELAQL
ncbi:HutD family protein [Agrobacterium tumefaciens]|uniref:HutD/Ves family protein n=1 Tax=Agrobacterium tumefaciens TaxID=358 RepID=UPI00287BEA08|nr:HutD family protein [Agrobacterium tumefaciens]MDS7594547.1 HutD family protein [Agrobacterium tumefaciens]